MCIINILYLNSNTIQFFTSYTNRRRDNWFCYTVAWICTIIELLFTLSKEILHLCGPFIYILCVTGLSTMFSSEYIPWRYNEWRTTVIVVSITIVIVIIISLMVYSLGSEIMDKKYINWIAIIVMMFLNIVLITCIYIINIINSCNI